MKRTITGMIQTRGEWDKISFDMDNSNIEFLGMFIDKFNDETINELIRDHTSRGKLLLSDGIKPLQYMNKFKL